MNGDKLGAGCADASGDSDVADQRLIARIKEGDRQAFNELYLGYSRRLARFVARVARNPADVEEVTNDTLYIVWTKASGYRHASRVSTWIFGIAYRRALKLLRKSTRYERAILREQREADLTECYLDSRASEERQALKHALGQLSPEQRLVTELAYFLGYTCEEISEIAGAPVNTIKSRMLHARKKLQVILARENFRYSGPLCHSPL